MLFHTGSCDFSENWCGYVDISPGELIWASSREVPLSQLEDIPERNGETDILFVGVPLAYLLRLCIHFKQNVPQPITMIVVIIDLVYLSLAAVHLLRKTISLSFTMIVVVIYLVYLSIAAVHMLTRIISLSITMILVGIPLVYLSLLIVYIILKSKEF